MTPPASATGSRATSVAACTGDRRQMVVAIDALELVLPQDDIKGVESVLDMRPSGGGEVACGHVGLGGDCCPVYALDSGLCVVLVPPPRRRVCVVIEHQGARVGFLADGVTPLQTGSARDEAIPPAMTVEGSPIRGLIVHDSRVLFATTAAGLGEWLASRGVAPRSPVPVLGEETAA